MAGDSDYKLEIPKTLSDIEVILNRTQWAITYEVSFWNILEFFSNKSEERVMHFQVQKESFRSFTFKALAETWGQKKADSGWRSPVVSFELTANDVNTKGKLKYQYQSIAEQNTAAYGIFWVVVIFLALFIYDRVYAGLGFYVLMTMGFLGVLSAIATWNSVQKTRTEIERKMNLLLKDSLQATIIQSKDLAS